MEFAERNYTTVVLTGASCSGKTTSIAYIQRRFADRGVRVLVAPEIATQLISGGLQGLPRIAAEDQALFLRIEAQILRMQHACHQHYEQLAQLFAPQPVIVLFDRAEMDIQAFTGPDNFAALLQEQRLTLHDVCTSYDAVMHLVTAADGAAEHYTLANNAARSETPEQAIAQDRRILRAWNGHPHLRIIDNSTDFEGKLRRLYNAVANAAGLPAVELERKFLLRTAPDFTCPELEHAAVVHIEQTYLRSEDPQVELRVRKRTQEGSATYYWTRKEPTEDPTRRQEREAIIRPSEYMHLLGQRDETRRPLCKTRYCFPYAGSYCELDVIPLADGQTVHLLEIELIEADQRVTLPPFLDIEREVTDEPQFKSAQMAAQV